MAEPGEIYRRLAALPIRIYLTTSYDDLLFKTLAAQGRQPSAQLQVACALVWQASDGTLISRSLLHKLGGTTGILARYLEETIERAARLTSAGVTELCIRLEETLVTPAGTRASVLFEQGQSGGIPNEVVDLLTTSNIVRRELRAGALWIELTHDLLVDALRLLRRRRQGI